MSILLLSPLAAETNEVIALWENGQKKQAKILLKEWKQKDQVTPDPLVTEAQIMFLEGKYKTCLRMGKKILKKYPEAAGAFYWRGRAYEALENMLEAANEYRAAIKAEKDYESAQQRLEQVLVKLEGV